jgi:hypothetical protein
VVRKEYQVTWVPPPDDPSLITSAAYDSTLEASIQLAAYYYAPGVPDAHRIYSWQHVPLFAVKWRSTSDVVWLDRAEAAVERFVSAFRAQTAPALAALAGGRASIIAQYWFGSQIAALLISLDALGTTARVQKMRESVGMALAEHYVQLPEFVKWFWPHRGKADFGGRCYT